MRIVTGLTVVFAVGLAHAGKLPPPARLNLIQASCNALPPAVPGPCSPTFRFASGTVTMKSLREPQPTCPKTGQPTEAPGATLQMRGVTKSGAPFTGSLPVTVNFKTTFGDDPDGNCELRNVQVPNFPSLLGTLACKNGTCKGTAYPVACLPAQCADTPVLSEFGSVQAPNQQFFGPVLVLDDADNAFATPGTALLVAPTH
jgi:hypothetical protein